MSNPNLVTVYLGKEDADLKEALEGMDNKARAEIAKAALRLYFARKPGNPGKPWINGGAVK
ncbi:hypothetical protein [Gorillibacterium sp. sgz5001074]|uniref:hypothetical protein n=1 Tax=Gorillibacterium sp. sgz5001074 TaxID=3446695 RepID=UPI003F680B3A